MSIPAAEALSSFNVITWNILLDKTRPAQGLIKPQSERIESQAATLAELGLSLDVVMLQEVEKTAGIHSGEVIADSLGYERSFWFGHNTSKRKGENIGVFGRLVQQAEAFDVGHDKKAVISRIGDVAVVGLHHRKELWGTMRQQQMEAVIDRVDGLDKVVIAGDANALWFEKSRRLLRRAGFQSAFSSRPMTHPSERYASIMHSYWQRRIFPRGKSIDIIETRGVSVKDSGIFEGDSDHLGCYATIISQL